MYFVRFEVLTSAVEDLCFLGYIKRQKGYRRLGACCPQLLDMSNPRRMIRLHRS
jgi:hypothetical protein